MDKPITPTSVTPPQNPDEEIVKLRLAVKDLKKTRLAKEKDRWDKAGIVSQYLSGFVIALLGIVVTIYAQMADARQKDTELKLADKQSEEKLTLSKQQSDAQLELSKQQSNAQNKLQAAHDKAESDLANRQNFLAYMDKLLNATDSGRRAELLGQMEAALTPEEAVRIALDYAHPPESLGDVAKFRDDQKVFRRAILLAQHLRASATGELRQIRSSETMPDREIAKGILGEQTKVYIRASNVDDFADIKLNGTLVRPRLTFGEDSGWIDITDQLTVGNLPAKGNELTFLVINGQAGGYGGRFQISAGVQQYDTGPYGVNTCPCNKDAFAVVAHLRLLKDHTVQLLDTPSLIQF